MPRIHHAGLRGLILLFVAFSWPTLGCSHSKVRFKPALLVSERDIANCLELALEHRDADVRREAIHRISKTRYRSRQVVIDALDLIARTDDSAAVRCAAIRALGESGDAHAPDTMLDILRQAREEAPSKSGPPGNDVRQAAMQVLARRAEHDQKAAQAVCSTAVDLLKNDASRDVRVLAARVLGFCPSIEPLRTLIATLRLRDFGVVHEAERSLMRLTGTAFAYNPRQWEQWLASTDDPFRYRGRLDAKLEGRP